MRKPDQKTEEQGLEPPLTPLSHAYQKAREPLISLANKLLLCASIFSLIGIIEKEAMTKPVNHALSLCFVLASLPFVKTESRAQISFYSALVFSTVIFSYWSFQDKYGQPSPSR